MRVFESIRLFQYWNPAVKLFTDLLLSTELSVRFARIRSLIVKLPSVESTWFHNGTLIFKFRGVDSISDAEMLTGAEVRVPLSQRTPLDDGEFFQDDLWGCEVVDRATGQPLGKVSGWEDGGGSGLLVVDGGLLIPFARSICVEIDPAARRIAVDLPPGLKDLNRL